MGRTEFLLYHEYSLNIIVISTLQDIFNDVHVANKGTKWSFEQWERGDTDNVIRALQNESVLRSAAGEVV